MKNITRLITVLFVLLPLTSLLYNSFELGYKINLPGQQYLAVQGYNNDTSWLIFFEVGAVMLTAVLVILEKNKKYTFRLLLAALLCFVISMGLYYFLVLPADLATGEWGYLPADWQNDRDNWEYVNAIRALLNLAGFVCIIFSFLKNRNYYRIETSGRPAWSAT